MVPTYSGKVLKGLVAFEGVDGSGTSTQSGLLERNLKAAGIRVSGTMEPTGGPVGCLIRSVLRGRLTACATRTETDRFLAHLFAADRFDHLYNSTEGVVKQINAGAVAITTRYFFSSYAYNASNEEIFSLVDRLNCDFPVPEVTVFLRCPVDVSLARIASRDVLEYYEKEDELLRVSRNYDRIFAPIADRVLEYDSRRPAEELAGEILRDVRARILR